MKCPECEQNGDVSKLFAVGETKTMLGWNPYYDEEGVYHAHDPNRTTVHYRCSNGHSFTGQPIRPPCPVVGCRFNEEGQG